MRIIAFIERPLIIKKILKHLGIWDTHNHDPPQKPAEKIRQIVYDDTYSLSPSFRLLVLVKTKNGNKDI